MHRFRSTTTKGEKFWQTLRNIGTVVDEVNHLMAQEVEQLDTPPKSMNAFEPQLKMIEDIQGFVRSTKSPRFGKENDRAFLEDKTYLSSWRTIMMRFGQVQTMYAEGYSDEGLRKRAAAFLRMRRNLVEDFDEAKMAIAAQLPDVFQNVTTMIMILDGFYDIYSFQTQADRTFKYKHIYEPEQRQSKLSKEGSADEKLATVRNYNPMLLGPTCVAILGCLYPVSVAWSKTQGDPNSLKLDSNFWWLVSSSIMQLLGFWTTMIPVFRFSPIAAWIWSWAFAALGLSCTVASMPLYVYFPPQWASMATFVASAAQACVILQLMLAVDGVNTSSIAEKKST